MGMRNMVRMGMRTMMRTTTARIRGEPLSRTLGGRDVFRTSVLKHGDGLRLVGGSGANHMMACDTASFIVNFNTYTDLHFTIDLIYRQQAKSLFAGCSSFEGENLHERRCSRGSAAVQA